jgi:hypothetical protein
VIVAAFQLAEQFDAERSEDEEEKEEKKALDDRTSLVWPGRHVTITRLPTWGSA